jgi:hypothetical protein
MKIMMAAATALMVLGCMQAASAQDGGHAGLRGACRADFQQYCAGIPEGGASRVQCLKDHQDKLSGECKAALSATTTARQACALDAQKYCAESKPGADRLKCMKDNKENLSDGCKSALSTMAVGGD